MEQTERRATGGDPEPKRRTRATKENTGDTEPLERLQVIKEYRVSKGLR